MSDPQRPLEDYRIPGTNLISFSQWSRENIPKPPHAIALGQIVDLDPDELMFRMEGDNDALLAEFKHEYRSDSVVSALIANLEAWRKAPDMHDQDLDDLRMKVVAADVAHEKCAEALQDFIDTQGAELTRAQWEKLAEAGRKALEL